SRIIHAADDPRKTCPSCLRSNKNNLRAWGHGAGPFYVQVGFQFVACDQAGIGTVDDNAELAARRYSVRGDCGVRRKSKHGAKLDDVLSIDIGLADDGDRLSGTVVGCGGTGGAVRNAVDLREIGGAYGIVNRTVAVVGE